MHKSQGIQISVLVFLVCLSAFRLFAQQQADFQIIKILMIQFDRIRKSSVLRDKVYYLCNHIKFYSINDTSVAAFYFLMQSLALISTFIASPIADSTTAVGIMQTINSLFFFYSNDLYLRYDDNLVLSHIISFLLFFVFLLLAYFTYTLNHTNRLAISKSDLKKIKLVQTCICGLVTFNIPLGSFIWYYVMKLFQMQMEYFVIFSLFNLACLVAVIYIMEECSIESDLKNYKSLSRLYCKNESIHSIVKMMVRMVIASFNSLARSVIIVSLLALMVFDLYELRVSIFSKKYLNSTTESLYYYKNVATVILEVMMLFCLMTSFPLITNNFFLSVISTSFLAFFALSQYKQHKKLHLILDGLDAVNTEDDAKIYMLEMISMIDNHKSSGEIFTLSLITIHREKCKQDTCFCQSINFSDYNKLNNRSQFLKKFVLSKLQGVAEKFSGSYLILSILLNYKLSIMSSFSKVYYVLKSYTQKNEMLLQSFNQQYMLYQVEIIIEKEIEKNRQDRYVEVEKIFNEDLLKGELTRLMHQANDSFTEKYKLLGQEICNLNHIDEICLKISNNLRAIEGIWKDFQGKDSFNLKIYEIFLIYFEYIIFSRKHASMVKATIVSKTRSLQQLKGISEQNMERYLYTERACVVEIMYNKDRVGIVTNISSSCQQVFKFSRDQALEKDFHELMPEYFALEHRKWAHEWFENQVLTGKLLGLVGTHFVDSSGNSYSCSLHMKISSVGFKLRFYVMLIRDNSEDYLLLNNNLEIQGIGSKLINDQVFQLLSLKKQIGEFTDANIKDIVGEMGEGQLIKRRIIFRNETNLNYSQKKVAFAILGASSQMDTKEIPDPYIHQCEVLFQRHLINKFTYYTLRFYEVRKMVKHNNSFFFMTINNSKNFQGRKAELRKEYRHESYTGTIDNQMDSDVGLKAESSNESEMKDEDNKFQMHNMSSIAESGIGESNIMFSKLAEEIKEKAVDHKKVTDRRLSITTGLLIFMIGVVVASAELQALLFQTGMKSYNELIFASAAVSNNNQLMQIGYNRITTLNYYCTGKTPKSRCIYLLANINTVISKVSILFVKDIAAYLSNTTSLTGIKYYSFYDRKVELTLKKLKIEVTIKQFLQYYYYALKTIFAVQPQLVFTPNDQLQFLNDNWQDMKRINSEALLYYEQASLHELYVLKLLTYSLFAIYLITLLVLIMFAYYYYAYIECKKETIIRLHGYLTHLVCGKLKQIGDGVRQCLDCAYQEFDTTLELDATRQNKLKSQFRYQQNRKFNYALIFFFLIMGALNVIVLFKTTSLFSPAYRMMVQLTNMIDSQNSALETYLDLKTDYLFNINSNHSQTLDSVMQKVNTTEIPFVRSAKEIQTTISQLGGDFAYNFNVLLMNNSCNLAAGDLNMRQLFKCLYGMNYNIIQTLGVAAGVDFMLRNVLRTTIKLQGNSVAVNSGHFFSPLFEDVDDYAFYNFKVYQLIEAQVISGMAAIYNSIIVTVKLIVFVEMMALIAALLFWLLRLGREKKQLSNLYAQVLQLPQAIFRENKVILKILEENLTLKM